jgi:CheY-like chemotaxis protein
LKKSLGILLIDDDEDDGFLFESALKEIDKSIIYVFYRDGGDALKALKSFTLNPDYIFLDLNMPKMSGFEVLKELKNIKRLQHIPVIVCSTTKDKGQIEEVKALGAKHFISKPNSLRVMVTEVRAVLDEE